MSRRLRPVGRRPSQRGASPVDHPRVDPRAVSAPQARMFRTGRFAGVMGGRGRFTADLSLALDTPDADIALALRAVGPGVAITEFGFDLLRAQFRHAVERRAGPPGRVIRLQWRGHTVRGCAS